MRARLLLIFFIAGCHVPKPVARPYPPPTADEALAAVRAHAEKVQTLRASAKVEYAGTQGHVKLSARLLAARGGKLRVEAEAPLQGNVATLATDGRAFALADARNNQFLTGPAKGCNVARLIQIDLAPDDVVSVLLGGAPGLDGTAKSIEWDPTHGGREVVTLESPDGGHEKLFLDGRDHKWDLLSAERTDAAGHVLWRVDHDDWQDAGAGVRLPKRTHVAEPPSKVDVWLRWKELEPNVEPHEGVFQLAPPPGLSVVEVDC